MPSHRYTQHRRSHRQVEADRRAAQLATFLGRSLKNSRTARRTKQAEASAVAGISQSCWSEPGARPGRPRRRRPPLARANALALVEIWDWFADVGDAFRSWDRKLERLTARHDRGVSGCWAVRATRRNRELVAAHATLFAARFPGSGTAWLAALADPQHAMPERPAFLWVTVRGYRLFAARLGATRP